MTQSYWAVPRYNENIKAKTKGFFIEIGNMSSAFTHLTH